MRFSVPWTLIPDGEWIEGQHLWRVGFSLEALPLVSLLSGLVDVLLTVYDPRAEAVVFIVRSLDQTNTLFRSGALSGDPVEKYRKINQPLLVDQPTNESNSPSCC